MCVLCSDYFMPTDAGANPTGKVAAVAGTPLDFRAPLAIGEGLEKQAGVDASAARRRLSGALQLATGAAGGAGGQRAWPSCIHPTQKLPADGAANVRPAPHVPAACTPQHLRLAPKRPLAVAGADAPAAGFRETFALFGLGPDAKQAVQGFTASEQ